VDRKGTFAVKFVEIAEEVMRPKSAASTFKDSLRLSFQVEGTQETVSLAVQIADPADDLWGFVPNPDAAPKGNEAALRAFLEQNVNRGVLDVYVSGFIKDRVAPEGTHTFVRIVRIFPYTRDRDGKPRLGVTAVTADGMTATFYCPDPQFDRSVGKTPDEDHIGPLSPDVYIFQYLQVAGLDWAKMKDELERAKAYWPGHFDKDGQPIEPLFPDALNPWPGFLAMVERHGPKAFKLEIEQGPNGLRPKQVAKGLVKMIQVEGPTLDAEFEKERAAFEEVWNLLAQVVYAREDVRFLAGGKLTEDGKRLALATLVPLVRAHPDAVKDRNPDGSAKVWLPPSPNTWNINGLVCATFTAQRLLKLDEAARFDLVNLGKPDPEKVVKWAAGAVPEWSGAGYAEEEAL
jgi:hypothetical protein